MKLSVLIPAYDEVGTIDAIVDRVLAAPLDLDLEVLVVDDGSTDGTRERIEGLESRDGVVALYHDRNRGKGAALRTALGAATGDVAIVQDADLEYDPADYPKLLEPILSGRADVVFGSRFAGGEAHRVLYFWHSIANRALTLLSNVATNLNLTDMEAGYKAFTRRVYSRLRIEEDRFGVEPELTAKIARMDCRVYEVGISYSGRTYEQGKKIGWRDGVYALWCILKYNFLRSQ